MSKFEPAELRAWADEAESYMEHLEGQDRRKCMGAVAALREAAASACVPETVYKAVERILDENSAWIARPNDHVTWSIAFRAVAAAHKIIAEEATHEASQPASGSEGQGAQEPVDITWQDVRLHAGEGALSAVDVLKAANAHLRRLHRYTAPPAPAGETIEKLRQALGDARDEASESLRVLDAISEYVGCPHDEELTVDHVRQHYMALENAAQRQGILDAGRIANAEARAAGAPAGEVERLRCALQRAAMDIGAAAVVIEVQRGEPALGLRQTLSIIDDALNGGRSE